ncbi:MAG TPA: hypothetical protein P5216_00880, partial [Bacteroidota bacterium]|nr:hypothetical protein [Bacteroidota bacterium]
MKKIIFIIILLANLMFAYAQESNGWLVYKKSTNSSGTQLRWIRSIAADNKGTIWMATMTGLSSFNGITWHTFSPTNSPAFLGVAIDKNGVKWVGSQKYGLFSFDGSNWRQYTTDNSNIPTNDVNSIAFDKGGAVWISNYNGGLVKFDGKNWTAYNTSNSKMPSNLAISLAIDKHDNKWVGTRGGGFAKFDGKNWT